MYFFAYLLNLSEQFYNQLYMSTTDKLSNVIKPQKDEITQKAGQKCWHDKCYVWPGFILVVNMQF